MREGEIPALIPLRMTERGETPELTTPRMTKRGDPGARSSWDGGVGERCWSSLRSVILGDRASNSTSVCRRRAVHFHVTEGDRGVYPSRHPERRPKAGV